MTSPIPDDASLDFASDANYDVQSDAYDGTPVKVTPSAGVVHQGVRPGRQSAAQYFNSIFNGFAKTIRNIRAVLIVDDTPIVFTATGANTWVCPAGVYRVRVRMCGGGGGGGGGGWGTSSAHVGVLADGWSGIGGGGGGGAPTFEDVIPVIPGRSYDVHIGSGGGGGAGGVPFSTPAIQGTPGGQTFIRDLVTTLLIASTPGGRGGGSAQEAAADQPLPGQEVKMVMGGTSELGGFRPPHEISLGSAAFDFAIAPQTPTFACSPGDGGDGIGNYIADISAFSSSLRNGRARGAFAGGPGGTAGLNNGSGPIGRGGGPGGGGGASIFGGGGGGGAGGNGSAAGAAVAGQSGFGGGIGGGGGGGGAGGSTDSGSAGAGGAGGTAGVGHAVLTPVIGGYM